MYHSPSMPAFLLCAADCCCRAFHCGPRPDHFEPVQALSQQGCAELCVCEQPEDSHGGLQALQALLIQQEGHQAEYSQSQPHEGELHRLFYATDPMLPSQHTSMCLPALFPGFPCNLVPCQSLHVQSICAFIKALLSAEVMCNMPLPLILGGD